MPTKASKGSPPKGAGGRSASRRRAASSKTPAKAAPRRPPSKRPISREQLAHVASEWRTTVDIAREIIVMIGPDSRIVRANLATQDLFDRPIWDLVGAPADTVAQPLLGPTDPLRLDRTRKSGRPFRGEVRANGSRWFSLTVDPIPGVEGEWKGAVCRLRDVTQRKRADQRLRSSLRQVRNLAAHLQDAREEERSLIAHQIHDQLGHDLAALKLDLAWLQRQLPEDGSQTHQRVDAMTALVDRGLKTLRRISTELRPDLLDHFGPAAAIEWQAEELRRRSGVRTRLDLRAKDLDLSNTISTVLFRIVQETLSNVARHAGADQVSISLRRQGSQVVLVISDNGRGFDPAKVEGASFGLLAMRERARSLGGELSIESGAREGTTVTARLPIG